MTSEYRPTPREQELSAIIGAYNEVTERLKSSHERLAGEVGRLREELSLKNAELNRRERLAALGEMAAGLAHEIRNPLGGISLYASMLQDQLRDHPALSPAKKISNGVRSLERLVSDILDFAQEYRLERRWCGLGDVLMGVEDGLAGWVEQEGCEVVVEESARGARVHADPHRLGQAILNLMLNAVQAAGRGGEVRLSAAAEPADGSGGAIGATRIEVSDNGPGIPADKLERIFNPFFTTKSTGTGLGLAIVHRIVEAHGGVVRASNRPEGGARFELRLPAADEETESE